MEHSIVNYFCLCIVKIAQAVNMDLCCQKQKTTHLNRSGVSQFSLTNPGIEQNTVHAFQIFRSHGNASKSYRNALTVNPGILTKEESIQSYPRVNNVQPAVIDAGDAPPGDGMLGEGSVMAGGEGAEVRYAGVKLEALATLLQRPCSGNERVKTTPGFRSAKTRTMEQAFPTANLAHIEGLMECNG